MAHFYEFIPPELRTQTNQQIVERFASGAGVLEECIQGLGEEQLCSFPIPGKWSTKQVVVHLLDSDAVAIYRMKRIIAEDRPRLDVWDENRFVQQLDYQQVNAALAAQAFAANRTLMASILRRQPETAFARVALHPEVGELSLAEILRLYVHHLNHHLRFIEDKRRVLLGPCASVTS